MNVVFGIYAGYWVDWGAVDIHPLLRENIAQAVNRIASPVKNTSKDFGRKRHLHGATAQSCTGIVQGNLARPFKYLDYHTRAIHLYNSALAEAAIIEADVHSLFKESVFYAVDDNERAVNFFHANII